jgi:hypothetical protein
MAKRPRRVRGESLDSVASPADIANALQFAPTDMMIAELLGRSTLGIVVLSGLPSTMEGATIGYKAPSTYAIKRLLRNMHQNADQIVGQ